MLAQDRESLDAALEHICSQLVQLDQKLAEVADHDPELVFARNTVGEPSKLFLIDVITAVFNDFREKPVSAKAVIEEVQGVVVQLADFQATRPYQSAAVRTILQTVYSDTLKSLEQVALAFSE